MIARLRGQLIEKMPPWVVLDVAGVGYQVEVPLSTFEVLPALGEQSSLLIEMVVREDAMLLYGFATEKEKSLFRLLVKVNGIGPKLALAVLSSLSVDAFVQAVREKNAALLTKIPGVGKKTAERMVLELATAVDSIVGAFVLNGTAVPLSLNNADSMMRQQAIQALEALGYKNAEAAQRVDKAWQDNAVLSDQIKYALQVTL
ncbi:MAG: Holliday junction branch migration protein RuvA [Thiotrichales bacterium 32-46-8]|nr:Holliday junction branch migration protein RuvA [Gammaproteobacteria bacterium]OYX06531.1 MAG: Holliday junction branch migration protein RuvA [Thiotrichales bacterium 32-46-8]OYY25447.1 MAG: Holliday junction branch migration protein RuvA [Thiotrichales bacterium 35-46-9]OYZ03588.1 MAG: Holliday junction branch migration protein RuvA [Thiotrichales bacterium 16-46-22]OYZ40172.1 MAG: Holliday junction branch migration protein RuvA [Thiotrichales bacterium 24-47-4]OZA74359.1 MAG: Holliday ju